VKQIDATVPVREAAGPLVLVVDDELPMQKLLRIVLSSRGLRTQEATSGAEALGRAAAHNPDLVLLDLGLPDSDGIEVTRRLREWTAAPILIISARGHERDKVAVLDAGANDYLTKPFAAGELLARIRVWLRQTVRILPDGDETTIEVGELRIDLARRLVCIARQEVHLTPIEYKVLVTLARKAGTVLTYQQLLKEVWGPDYSTQKHYLHVYMAHLRTKLEPDPTKPRFLVTELGVGYRLNS
jgi:two-component system KDP operon response regulator KdpE